MISLLEMKGKMMYNEEKSRGIENVQACSETYNKADGKCQ